jgi:hypothetical protein
MVNETCQNQKKFSFWKNQKLPKPKTGKSKIWVLEKFKNFQNKKSKSWLVPLEKLSKPKTGKFGHLVPKESCQNLVYGKSEIW